MTMATSFKRQLVVGLVAAALALLAAVTQAGPTNVAATVYGHPITKAELAKVMTNVMESDTFKIESAAGGFHRQKHLLAQKMLTYLIQTRVYERLAKRLHVTVSKKRVRHYAHVTLEGQGITSRAKLTAYLRASNTSRGAFMRNMRLAVLTEAVRRKIYARATPSRSEIRSFYRTHRWAFLEERAWLILFPLNDGHIAQRVFDQIHRADPADRRSLFASLVHRYSIDPTTKATDGDMGWILNGSLAINDPALNGLLERLPVGRVSRPVHTARGLAIVWMRARRPASFRKAKGSVEAKMLSGNRAPDVVYSHFLAEAFRQAHVSVNPQYGVFYMPGFSVIDPPASPSPLPASTEP